MGLPKPSLNSSEENFAGRRDCPAIRLDLALPNSRGQFPLTYGGCNGIRAAVVGLVVRNDVSGDVQVKAGEVGSCKLIPVIEPVQFA